MSTGVNINKKWRNSYAKVVSKMFTSVDNMETIILMYY